MGATHLPSTEFDGTEIDDQREAAAEARLGDPAEPMVQLLAPDGTLGTDPVFSEYAERLDAEKLRGFYADMAKIRRFDVRRPPPCSARASWPCGSRSPARKPRRSAPAAPASRRTTSSPPTASTVWR